MDTVGDVIDALGGTAAVADRIGSGRSTVSMWKARQSIPALYWRQLVEMASDRGVSDVTYEALSRFTERHPEQPEAAE